MIIDEILDMMDDMLDEASSVPFSSKKGVIDLDKMRGCINDLRLNLPDEIRNAFVFDDLLNFRRIFLPKLREFFVRKSIAQGDENFLCFGKFCG